VSETATTDDVFADDIRIPADDGYLLGATLFLPRGPRRNAVLINSATAVPRKIYRGFASYLASRGSVVLTYDYRGIGGSRPPSLRNFDVRLADWAERDVASMVAWMRHRYGALPLSYVGHSFGGQALGLLHNNDQVARALLVASQAAYWRLLTPPETYKVYTLMMLLGRPLVHLLGYLPGHLGLGEDLPREVFLQWCKWIASPRYFFDDRSLMALVHFPSYRNPLMALCIADDKWAPRASVELLCAGFSNATPDIVTVTPAEAGVPSIGHFGFFRPQHRTTLWKRAADWLLAT
jgi:predicted alpha/beta hydrolase